MGEVYRARDARLSRDMVGKKLDPIENAGFQRTCLNGAGQR
jgi:hypothetical protein